MDTQSRAATIRASVVLVLIPAAFVVAALSARAASPGWLNYDLEYTYLLNALRLHQRLPILFVAHPAATLAWLYAAILYVSHAIAPIGSPSLVEDIWRNPEAYVHRVHLVLMLLLVPASIAAGVLVWQRTRRVWAGLALQAGLLLLSPLAVTAGLISPETLLIAISVLFASALALRTLDEATDSRLWAVLGVLAGLGIATKSTFAVVVLAPVLVSRSVREALLYVAVLTGTAALAIAPIWARVPRLVSFLTGLVVHTGSYGSGNSGVELRTYVSGANLLVHQNKVPVGIMLLSIVLWVTLRWTTVSLGRERWQLRALGWLSAVQLVHYAAVARQPYPRYLIPAVLLMGVNLALMYTLASARWPRRTAQCGVVLLLLVSTIWVRNTVSAIESARVETANRTAVAEAAADLKAKGATVVLGTWAASPAYAFAIGEYWVGNDSAALAETLYPHQLFMDGSGALRTWREGLGRGWDWPEMGPPPSAEAQQLERRRLEDLLNGRRVIVQGSRDDLIPTLQGMPQIEFQTIRQAGTEAVFELRLR